MITLLTRYFIKDKTSESDLRSMYGVICGGVGIFLNLVLFAIKFFAGFISGSIAITADAFNNLSDAGSSIVTLIGFKLANQKPDSNHPFGHGRLEYISGFVISMLIILMGYELITSSINKIFNPQEVVYNPLVFVILIISILVKVYMYYYNKVIGKEINSSALLATSADSLSDSVATLVVLVCSILSYFTSLNIEGYCGVVVGLFVGYAGYNAAKDTLEPLLGSAPDDELVAKIENLVLQNEAVLGIHDLEVHDYGPGRLSISLHAEVSAEGSMLELHDEIDNIEMLLRKTLNCSAVIHMDPICNNDEQTVTLRNTVTEFLHSISPRLSLHDFRIVTGPTHTNILFDIVSPFNFELTDSELLSKTHAFIHSIDQTYFGIIHVDKI